MEALTPELFNVLKYFAIDGELKEIRELSIGHIHKTYVGTWEHGARREEFIHQQINHNVFKDIETLSLNIQTILSHLEKAKQKDRYALSIPILVALRNGGTYKKDDEGNFWRTFSYIKNTKTFNKCTDVALANEAGRCFGQFHLALSDLEPKQVQETIPFFFEAPLRIKNFFEAVGKDSHGRVKEIAEEIQFIQDNTQLATLTTDKILDGSVPLRVIHGDMKLNNLLFDASTLHGEAVVDLDTCMPGTVLYDFGDLARTVIINCEEDEPDLKKVTINKNFFTALYEGYILSIRNVLTQNERTLLRQAPAAVTLLLAIRFLTDYLEGDRYFRTHRPKQNLERGKCQLKAVREMLKEL